MMRERLGHGTFGVVPQRPGVERPMGAKWIFILRVHNAGIEEVLQLIYVVKYFRELHFRVVS
jgi:hypothetical protein